MTDDDKREDRGFQPIGNPVRKIIDSPRDLASAFQKLPRGSSIIGPPKRAQGEQSSIGQRHGATGAVAMRKPVEELLRGAKPEETDTALLASLPPGLLRSLTSKRKEIIDEKYGYDLVFKGYEIGRDATIDDLLQARDLVEQASIPSGDAETIAELTRLRMLVKVRAEEEGSLAALMAVMAEEIDAIGYPPDVMRGAMRAWSRREKWWPSWAELKAELDREFRKRKSLANAITKAIRNGDAT